MEPSKDSPLCDRLARGDPKDAKAAADLLKDLSRDPSVYETEAFKQEGKKGKYKGHLPLHIALRKGFDEEVVKKILKKNPHAATQALDDVEVPDENPDAKISNYLPLHMALREYLPKRDEYRATAEHAKDAPPAQDGRKQEPASGMAGLSELLDLLTAQDGHKQMAGVRDLLHQLTAQDGQKQEPASGTASGTASSTLPATESATPSKAETGQKKKPEAPDIIDQLIRHHKKAVCECAQQHQTEEQKAQAAKDKAQKEGKAKHEKAPRDKAEVQWPQERLPLHYALKHGAPDKTIARLFELSHEKHGSGLNADDLEKIHADPKKKKKKDETKPDPTWGNEEQLEKLWESLYDAAVDGHSPMHAMIVIQRKKLNPRFYESLMYSDLLEFDWGAIHGALCYMFLTPTIGVTFTLKRICEILDFLDSQAGTLAETDVDAGEDSIQKVGQLQQVAVKLVECLPEHEQEKLWCETDDGLEILEMMQLADARLFFARPQLQRILADMWLPIPDEYRFVKRNQNRLRLWAGCFMNLLVAVVFILLPCLEGYVVRRVEEKIKEYDVVQEHNKQNKNWLECYKKKQKQQGRAQAIFEHWTWAPLLLPRQKKYIATFTNILFTMWLSATEPEDAYAWPTLVLSLGAFYAEVREFAHHPRLWKMDRLNIAECISFGCVSIGCILILIVYYSPGGLDEIDAAVTEKEKETDLVRLFRYGQAFKSVGVLFLGVSQGVSLLRMSSVYGPLVSMVVRMIVDMLKWVVLSLPIIFSLVAALITLYRGSHFFRPGVEDGNSEMENAAKEACDSFYANDETSAPSWFGGVRRFFEVQIGREAPFECLEKTVHSLVSPILLNLGVWVTNVLMLNMLIAMMAKTFDSIYERTMEDYQYHFSMFVVSAIKEPAVPPVLRLFGLPCDIVCGLRQLVHGCLNGQNERHYQGEGTVRKTMLDSFSIQAVMDKTETEKTEKTDKDLEELLKELEGRFQLFGKLEKEVADFLSKHDAESSIQDSFWRKNFGEKLYSLTHKVDKMKEKICPEDVESKGKGGPLLASASRDADVRSREEPSETGEAATQVKEPKKPRGSVCQGIMVTPAAGGPINEQPDFIPVAPGTKPKGRE